MAKINKQHKWDICVHALCPFGRGFALCSYGMDICGKELPVNNGLPTIKVYAVVEDCMIDGEDHGETRLFSDKKHA